MIAADQLAPHALTAMELVRDLPPSALEEVAASARVRRLPKDLRIFSQGDEDVRAHAVIEGGVRIAQSGSDGAQVIIRFIGPGEMFGTVGLFTDGRYPADAIIGKRLQEVQDRVRELATPSAERRVAHAVLRAASRWGWNAEETAHGEALWRQRRQ